MNKPDTNALTSLLAPHSVAVIGASGKMNCGGRLLQNLQRHGFAGAIYPVHPTNRDIFGMPCYASVQDIPGAVDLAVIAVKAERIEAILQQCEEKHVGAVLIVSAGFREQGTEEGASRERMLAAWSARTGIPVCGPNCLGIGSAAARMWATPAASLGDEPLPDGGSVGLVSHCGATAFGPLLSRSRDYGVSFRYIVSTGNETCLSMTELGEHMLDDPEVKALGLFIEVIRDGEAFVRLVDKALMLRKPIIALKLGESEAGRQAAASHKAPATGNRQVFEVLCRQKAVILAKDYDEFIGAAACCAYGRELAGTRLAVMSHSGGIGGFAGDKLGAAGFAIQAFKPETRARIGAMLAGFGQAANPLVLPDAMHAEQILDIHRILDAEEELDGYVYATHGKLPFVEWLANIAAATAKPVYLVWTGSQEDPALADIRKLGMPLFLLPEKLALTLERLRRFREASSRKSVTSSRLRADRFALDRFGFGKFEDEHPEQDRIGQTRRIPDDAYALTGLDAAPDGGGAASNDRGGVVTLSEVEGKRVLNAIGISTPRSRFLAKGDDLARMLHTVDFDGRRFALKIVSRAVTHKSDSGGVALNVTTSAEVAQFYEKWVVQAEGRSAIDGILLEEMVHDKIELTLSATIDDQFGPVVMVGLGGVYTELFRIAGWRIAPFDREEARRLLAEIPGLLAYLGGYRQTPEADTERLLDTIAMFSKWVYELRDRLVSVEINPLAVRPKGKGVCALDCVMMLKHD